MHKNRSLAECKDWVQACLELNREEAMSSSSIRCDLPQDAVYNPQDVGRGLNSQSQIQMTSAETLRISDYQETGLPEDLILELTRR